MPRIFRGLFKWSLELTGLSIIWFNYQPYDRQQRMIALYRFTRNSLRTIHYLYGLTGDFKDLMSTQIDSEAYKVKLLDFQNKSAERIRELCELNKGVYARMGQIMAGMTGVLSPSYLIQFKKLDNVTADETSYENIKTALTESLQKPMKQIFDGFQSKPFNVGLFYQTHKSILLQNYKQSMVKIMLPSIKYQNEYDLWFINKCLTYIGNQIKSKYSQYITAFNEYSSVIQQAQDITKLQTSFPKQVQNSQKLNELIYQQNSAFYIPYYYQKYASNSVIIRQHVEGTQLDNPKGLKELGLSAQVAYAYIMSEIHHMMHKLGLINGRINQKNILIRKFVKPAKSKETEGQVETQVIETAGKKGKNTLIAKGKELIHPQYQVVFLSVNNLQPVPPQTRDSIQNYWANIKKSTKKKLLPSVSSFYSTIPGLNNLKGNSLQMLKEKYYLYEPMLDLYQKFVKKGTASTSNK